MHKDGPWVDYGPGPDDVQQKFVDARRKRKMSPEQQQESARQSDSLICLPPMPVVPEPRALPAEPPVDNAFLGEPEVADVVEDDLADDDVVPLTVSWIRPCSLKVSAKGCIGFLIFSYLPPCCDQKFLFASPAGT